MKVKTATEVPVSAEWGDGDKVLVFLHYFGGAAQSWQWVAAQMPDYRCIAINLPGFGGVPALEQPSLEGYAHSVLDTLASLGIEDYTLVGHSMGGKIALQIAAKENHPPQQVILIAPSPPTQEPMPEEEKQRLLNNHPSQDNAKTTVTNATQKPLSDEQQALAIQTHMAVEETAWQWWLLEGMDQVIAEQMSQLRNSVTILASQDDPVIPYDTICREVLELVPDANLVTTKGVGHLIPLEAADWVVKQVRQITTM